LLELYCVRAQDEDVYYWEGIYNRFVHLGSQRELWSSVERGGVSNSACVPRTCAFP
jgi:hypothetical protein